MVSIWLVKDLLKVIYCFVKIPSSLFRGGWPPNLRLGASQSDIAFLEAESIDWENRVIRFARKETGSIALMRFDTSSTVLKVKPLIVSEI